MAMIRQSLVEINASSTSRLFAGGSSLLRGLCTAAAAAAAEDASSAGTSAKSPASSTGTRRLCQKILALDSTGGSVADVLNYGHRVGKGGLIRCVKELCENKRYQHCLEILEWMKKRKYRLSTRTHTLAIDMICKAKGIAEAEKYFESLSQKKKNLYTYGALLNCYCAEKMVDKANALFEEMDRLQYLTGVAFNNMMTLALTSGEQDKVPDLAEEMRRRNLPLDSNAYSLLIKSYRQLDDVEGVERTIEETEKDGENCPETYAVPIDIICKTKGVPEAEKYFESLSPSKKNLYTYEALLNRYCTEKMVDKATALYEEMTKLNKLSSLAFNNMMTLALTSGQPGKVPGLVEEMRRRNLPLNSHAYSLLIQSYQQLNDMEGIERTIEEIDKDGENCHWSIYSNLAAVYIRAGDFEKADKALKRLEEVHGCDLVPYHDLISFYAGMGDLDAVNRVWDTLKSYFKANNNLSYLIMLQNLLKLGQMDQVQTCFEEWKSGCKEFDLRIASVVIDSYLGQNKPEEAEQVFNDACEKSGMPFFSGRKMFIAYLLNKREIHAALRHLKGAIDAVKEHGRWEWKPDAETVSAFWKCFEEKMDVDGVEEFSKLLKKVNCLDSKAYFSFLGTYMAAGKTAPDVRERNSASC